MTTLCDWAIYVQQYNYDNLATIIHNILQKYICPLSLHTLQENTAATATKLRKYAAKSSAVNIWKSDTIVINSQKNKCRYISVCVELIIVK